MSDHEHKHEHCCKHKVMAYCEVCKVAYCKDCGKEWREYSYTFTYPNYPSYTIPQTTYTTSDTINISSDINSHNH